MPNVLTSFHRSRSRPEKMGETIPAFHQHKPAKMIKTIPTDLHLDILKAVPSKSLMRFRCVSKTWNRIICDPLFAKLHRTISQTRPSATTAILLDRDNWVNQKIDIYRIEGKENFLQLTIDFAEFGFNGSIVTEIVNGLVCFCFYKHRKVIVCNITTREVISLPLQPPNPPLYEPHPIYSLGYDPLNNEYKVLCILYYPLMMCKCMVFTLGISKEWRDIVIDPLCYELIPTHTRVVDDGCILCDTVCHDGAIHWLTQDRSGRYSPRPKQKLVSFDLREEKFRVIGVPAAEPITLVQVGGRIMLFAAAGSKLFILEDYQNQVWIERSIICGSRSLTCPIGSMGNKIIFVDDHDLAFATVDPNNGRCSPFLLSIWLELSARLGLRAKYSIFEIVENIFQLRPSLCST